MANLFDYIKKNSDKTFNDLEFNEIDAAIFSLLSYIDLKTVEFSRNISLGDCLHYFLEYGDRKAFLKKGFVQKDLVKLSKVIKDTIRFKDIQVLDYVNVLNEIEQFAAVTFRLPNGIKIISYEGTDSSLIGWEEDLAFCYKFPVPSERDAIKYINRMVNIFDRKVIVVGHSKGGHLALVASMYARPIAKLKIQDVYNFDGPGLRKKEIESKKYKRIENRLKHLIPHYSVVGLLLRHGNNYKVVKARKDLYAHSLFTWEIYGNDFKKEKLSTLSSNLDKSIIIWLDEHGDMMRKMIADRVFAYLRNAGINNTSELTKIKNVLRMYKDSKDLDKETKDLIANFIKFNYDYHINNKKSEEVKDMA